MTVSAVYNPFSNNNYYYGNQNYGYGNYYGYGNNYGYGYGYGTFGANTQYSDDPSVYYDLVGENVSRSAQCSAEGAEIGNNILGFPLAIVGGAIGGLVGSIWDLIEMF